MKISQGKLTTIESCFPLLKSLNGLVYSFTFLLKYQQLYDCSFAPKFYVAFPFLYLTV